MSDSRTKNTIRNIRAGLFNKIIAIVLPFVNRTAILWILGAEFTGLASLFSSILQVLNLAELGFNTAIVYSLYKPMADRDEKKICEMVSLFKKIYTIVGTIILFGGLIILPFISYLIKGTYPNTINIYLLYLLYLINSAISYYLFAYKECLLIADQRQDISKNIRTVVEILRYGIQLAILLFTKNFYLYVIVAIIGTITTNLCIEFSTRKRYPFYKNIKSKLKIPKELKNQVSGLMVNKICDTFRNSFDSLIISAFIGLTAVTIYGNYFYVYTSIYGIMSVICISMSASIGNSIIKKSVKDNYKDFLSFSQIYAVIIGISTTCLLCVYQPFMKVWAGSKLLLSTFNMILFCIYFYSVCINNIRNQYISGNGMWDKTRFSSVLEAIANLILNIVLGKLFGITGVLLATVITILLFNYIQRNKILFINYFKNESIKTFYKEQLYYLFITILCCLISYFICDRIKVYGFYKIIVNGLISAIISILILCISIRLTKRFEYTRTMLKNIVKNIK